MRLIGIISCTWLLISMCNTQDKVDELSDLNVYSDFSDREVEVIQEFLFYLDSSVSVFQIDSSSLSIYAKDSSTYRESDLDKIINELLKSENLRHLQIALTKLKSEILIEDFWRVKEVHRPFDGTSGLELTINPEGRFFNMLERIAATEDKVNMYYKLSLPLGELSPGMVAYLFKLDSSNFNFHSDSMRLIWIVHYITLITQIDNDLVKTIHVD